MQKGFASLEIILVVMIITILATVAVPNAIRIVDRAAVRYEQKRLYSELQFVRTLNRNANVYSTGMNGKASFLSSASSAGNIIELEINRGTNTYRILRDGDEIREPHKLSNGVTLSYETNVPDKIWFDASGYLKSSGSNSITIVLISRRGYKSKMVLDNVGRIRGE